MRLPIAALIGNEGPVLRRKVFHNPQCSVGDSVSSRFLCGFPPKTLRRVRDASKRK